MRYYDTETRNETDIASTTTIPQIDPRVSWWFTSIAYNEKLAYDDLGLPYKYTESFISPMVVEGVVVEGEAFLDSLERIKVAKLKEMKLAKKLEQLMPVTVGDNTFNGGREAGQKYDEALRLGLMLNEARIAAGATELIDVGSFGTADGSTVLVTESYAKEIVMSVGLASFSAWEKEQGLRKKINNATSIAEVGDIAWL